ncbi:MAG: metallophosphoesterase family protein [Cardiobacteriaceae bacterium]|nr:metallophosphoesterase family protein [Cardiobacteriaceae bacterium]
MNIFFTADTHFFHQAIIKHCDRPFHNAEEMNEAMIALWNKQVKKGDLVYHLGDVSFGGLAQTYRLLAELNGKICLIAGNHDDEIIRDPYIRERFEWIKTYEEIQIDKQKLVLFHYPLAQWRNAQRGWWHIYGHTHGSIQLSGKALDVGIDARDDFSLWSWEEVKAELEIRPILPYPPKPKYPKRKITSDGKVEVIV